MAMASAGGAGDGMPTHTASAIIAKTQRFSHDLAISGYSATKICYTNGTYIKSAKFVAGGRRWYLRYYPHGTSHHNHHVTFLLYHDRDSGADEDKVSVSYVISLLGLDGGNPVPVVRRCYVMTYDEPSTYTTGLITRTALEQPAYLRDDALSVRCEFLLPMIVTQTVLPPAPTEEEPPPAWTHHHVPADVHEALIRVFCDEVPTDVALEVGDQTFWAHRRLLAAQSPVLAAMFAGPMKESTAHSVRIDDMEPQVFEAMLHFIYCRGNLPVVDDDDDDNSIAMTQHLLVGADRYDLERLKSICADKLRGHINTSTVATTLEVAERHGCRALKDACYDFLAPHRGNLRALVNSEGYGQLIIGCPSVIVELLARVAPSRP